MTHQPLLFALTSESTQVSNSELSQVAGALQRQLVEDIGRDWTHALGSVVVANPAKIPLGYWPLVVKDDISQAGAAGFHTDNNGQPYAWIQYDSSWPLTASHELAEMACDAFGNRLYRAPTPDRTDTRHVVQILLEVGDPVEAYPYDIDGVSVSNYITHQYGNGRFGPYDHLGILSHAREVADGGYVSWMEPDGTWKQLTNFGGAQVTILGKRDTSERGSLREWVAQHGHKES